MRADARDYVFDATFASIAVLLNVLPGKLIDQPHWRAAAVASVCSIVFMWILRRTLLRRTGLTALWYFLFAESLVFWFFLETYFGPDHAPMSFAQATWLDVLVFPWSATALVLIILAFFLSKKRAGPQLSPPFASLLLLSGGAFGMLLGTLLALMGLYSVPLMPSVASVRVARAVRMVQRGIDVSTMCREFPFDTVDACRRPIGLHGLSRSGIELTYASGVAFCGVTGFNVVVAFDGRGRVREESTKPYSSYC